MESVNEDESLKLIIIHLSSVLISENGVMADDNHSWMVALSTSMLLVNVTAVEYFMREKLHTSRSEGSFSISENFGKHFNLNSWI